MRATSSARHTSECRRRSELWRAVYRVASHRTASPVETADAVTCGAIATQTVTVITRSINSVIACRAVTSARRLPRNASVPLEVEAISGYPVPQDWAVAAGRVNSNLRRCQTSKTTSKLCLLPHFHLAFSCIETSRASSRAVISVSCHERDLAAAPRRTGSSSLRHFCPAQGLGERC